VDENAMPPPDLVNREFTATRPKIQAGTITWNAANAATCLAGTTFPAACETWWAKGSTAPEVCNEVLVGTVPNGGACEISLECATLGAGCDPMTKKCTPP
jgi:hypothetical protein